MIRVVIVSEEQSPVFREIATHLSGARNDSDLTRTVYKFIKSGEQMQY